MAMKRKTPLFLAGLAGCATWLAGCFGSSTGPSSAEKSRADSLSAMGSDSLDQVVARMSSDQFAYGKEDLSTLRASHAQFIAALQANPRSDKAKLGAALTGVLLAGQSQKLSGLINDAMDAKSPFDTRTVTDAQSARVSVLRKVAASAAFPEFHQVQDAVADTLLPALEDAIAKVQDVYDDPSFTMTVHIDSAAKDLGHGEAAVLLAGLKASHALLTLFLAYDVDIDDNGSYDFIQALDKLDTVQDFSQLTEAQHAACQHIVDLLTPGSPFLAVRPAWAKRLAGVDDELLSALQVLRNGLVYTQTHAATDRQLLRACQGAPGDCVDSAGLAQGLAMVDSASKYLKQPYALYIASIDSTIQVDFGAYFRVQDYKKLFPYYKFYDSYQWSHDKPVLYFTTSAGIETGNFNDLKSISDQVDAGTFTKAEGVDKLSAIIHFQDPTFQGFLPGATEGKIWALVRKFAAANDNNNVNIDALPVSKRAASTLSPGFALSLLGGGR